MTTQHLMLILTSVYTLQWLGTLVHCLYVHLGSTSAIYTWLVQVTFVPVGHEL